MAREIREDEFRKMKLLERRDHNKVAEKKVRRLLDVIEKYHKVNLWHKIKEKIYGKCEMCQELENLKQ